MRVKLAYAFLAFSLVFASFTGYKIYAKYQADNKISCVSRDIPYTSKTVESSSENKGVRKVTTVGVNGSEQVCTKANGKEVAKNITGYPVNEVITLGTYVPPVYAQEDSDTDEYEYNSVGCLKNQYVRGHYRNGTWVDPYYRNSPNDDCY